MRALVLGGSTEYRLCKLEVGAVSAHHDARRLRRVEHFSLAVIGSGSGNVLIPDYRDGRKAAVIESRTFGGPVSIGLHSEQDTGPHG